MGSVRPWQIGLIVLAVIVLGTSAFFTIRDPNKVERADFVYLVDTTTAEVFKFNFEGKRGVILPAIHPDTGERTLYRVDKTESGQWEVDPRDLNDLDSMEVLNDAFNLDTRIVVPTNASKPRTMTRKDILKHLTGEGE